MSAAMSHRALLTAARRSPQQAQRPDVLGTGPAMKGSSLRALPSVRPAAAEAVEISRQNRLDRGRRDAQAGKCQRSGGDDIVAPQELDLIRGERRAWGN